MDVGDASVLEGDGLIEGIELGVLVVDLGRVGELDSEDADPTGSCATVSRGAAYEERWRVQQCDILMVRAGMRGALSDYTGVAVIRPRLCMLDGRTNGYEGLRSRSKSHSQQQEVASSECR